MVALTYVIQDDGLPYLHLSDWDAPLIPAHHGLAGHPERIALWEAARRGDAVARTALIDWFADHDIYLAD